MLVLRKLLSRRRQENNVENTPPVSTETADNKETEAVEAAKSSPKKEQKHQNAKHVEQKESVLKKVVIQKNEVKKTEKKVEKKVEKKNVKLELNERVHEGAGHNTKIEAQHSRVKYNDSRFKTEPDFSIHAEDIEFRVHSQLLKEKSEYIQKALSAEDSKCVDNVGRGRGIEFVKPPPTARALRILLDFVYTEKFNVPEEAKQDVYIASRILKISVNEDALIGWENSK